MTDDDGDGVYVLVKELAPGRYQYKFVENGNWLTDENAAEFTADGFGGQNSVVTVGAGGAVAGGAAVAAGVYLVAVADGRGRLVERVALVK